ncbi:MAG: methyltransferase domain-containing protein [Candidatus Omnitrophica bacterium]|nr:methyltransferase domain-containing protein [Candidatus Omnitrophota bacterium]
MCHPSCLEFGQTILRREDIEGKSVIEVGAYDVNGSFRPIAQAFHPSSYLGVDITQGPGVDEICRAEDLLKQYGENRFDMVICTEMLEHVLDWQLIVHNLKALLKPEGCLVVTTRSEGFAYHGYPYDFWRYDIEDARHIFSDLKIERLEKDPMEPGVFLFARKPKGFTEKQIADHKLYAVLLKRRSSIIFMRYYWPLWHLKEQAKKRFRRERERFTKERMVAKIRRMFGRA